MCCVLQSQMHGREEHATQYSPEDDEKDKDEELDTSSNQALEKPFHYCNTIFAFK